MREGSFQNAKVYHWAVDVSHSGAELPHADPINRSQTRILQHEDNGEGPCINK